MRRDLTVIVTITVVFYTHLVPFQLWIQKCTSSVLSSCWLLYHKFLYSHHNEQKKKDRGEIENPGHNLYKREICAINTKWFW